MNRYLTITIVVLLGALGIIATDLYVPALPAISHALSATPELTKLTVTFYMLGLGASPLLFGPLSDAFGRKPLLIICGALGLAGTLLALFAANIYIMIAARLLQGIGLGGSLALTRAVAGDLFEHKELVSVVAIMSLCISVGPALAPIAGSYLQSHFGWHSIFIALAIAITTLLTLIIMLVRETGSNIDINSIAPRVMMNNYKSLLTNKSFMARTACSSIAISSMLVYATLSPFILQNNHHLSVIQYGWSMGAVTIMAFVSRLGNIALLKKFNVTTVIGFGLASMLAGSTAALFFSELTHNSLFALIPPVMLVVFGAGLVPANTMVGLLNEFKTTRGSASALYGSLVMFGAFGISFIASMVPNSTLTLGLILTLISAMGLFLHWGVINKSLSLKTFFQPRQ